MLQPLLRLLLLLLVAAIPPGMATAQTAGAAVSADAARDAQTAWRLLDYVSVDYGEAVEEGAIVDETEYQEQVEFANTARAKIAGLPARTGQEALLAGVADLQALIAGKAPAAEVAIAARRLAADLLAIYPVPLAPRTPPSFARGKALYAENCAVCHGTTGKGDGPDAAAHEDIPPTDFTDRTRAGERSVFALYQVITQGLDDTPMRSFDELAEGDRWALAFYAGHFAFRDAERGADLWKKGNGKELVPDLETLVGLTPNALAERTDPADADALTGWLRQNPDMFAKQAGGSAQIALVRQKMAESLAASRAGETKRAADLALSAYLDGFEPIEPALATRNGPLMRQIEGAMIAYRAAIPREAPDALATRQQAIDALLDDVDAALHPDMSSALSTFLGAAIILLREGLEAILIVIAMIAFLEKADRREGLPYVHGGWASALVAGVLTWAIATWVIGISGASRELTEGIGSIVAALVLLSVGIWMHGKANAREWQRYIHEKMAKALGGRSMWLLFLLAFVVVYREVFETILFYAALAAQGHIGALLAGAAAAAVALAVIGWALLRYSRRLPITQFFRFSAWLMAILTVVLIGKGVSALQEAGMVGITLIDGGPRIDLLGIRPTWEGIGSQLAMVAALALGFLRNDRKAKALDGA